MRITKISQLPWKPEGLVLDPYAGNRRWWKGIDTNCESLRVVFVDKHYLGDGNILQDAAHLTFPDRYFDQIWADPPHLIRRSPFSPTSRFYRCSNKTPEQPTGYFGTYPTREALQSEWSAVAKELARVIKPTGFLVWKSIDNAKTISQCCNYDDLKMLTPCWKLVEELRFPSVMSWSSAETLYTKWVLEANF